MQVFLFKSAHSNVFYLQVCPLVIYLGAVMAIFYYTGLTQLVASKTAWLMQKTLQISAVESLSLTANVFLSVVSLTFLTL